MELTGGVHPVELIEKALEGRLTQQEEGILSVHLKGCPGCSGELEFARRVRSAGSVIPAGAPDSREMDRLFGRLLEDSARQNRVPLLAGIMAASLLLAWFTANPGGLTRWLATRPAVALSGSAMGLPQAELREALNFLDLKGPADGFMRSPLLAVQLADFESAGEMAGMSVIGGGNFGLAGDAVTGRHSLAIDQGLSGRDGVEIILPVRPMDSAVVPVAVSVWVKCSKSASITMSVRMPDGIVREGSYIRKARAGKWVWALLPLPALNGYERARIGGVGLRISGAGLVSLDHVELWCRGGGGG
jgi:hypothetical protein